ncbi:hypothetical protein DXK94_07165 [Arthrobacter sp. RT-1]|uniref:hypothetical protein n=1 Tax=Arthrobacter sp. RT-1 TaxID=2292263 RepID=UPI000E1EFAAA|nr:hypothetical protein [Arthrobacter sp. RT-1]RDV10944.1 hypothetical protein DXK94_07165 [Arthrobacter sp. RT-1]
MRLKQGGVGRLVLGWSATLLAAGLLSGCGTNDSGLQRDAARQLQARVLEVTQASSQNDPGGALKALEGLEAELQAAQAKGQISEDRRRNITTIATAVRADLDDAVAAGQAAADKAAADKAVADKAVADQAAAAAAAAAAPVETPVPSPEPEPEPAPEPDRDDDKKGGKGKGSD